MNEACGAFGCVLPKGHNRGQADVPENHLSAEDGFQFAALRRPYEELHAENERLYRAGVALADENARLRDENKRLRERLDAIFALAPWFR